MAKQTKQIVTVSLGAMGVNHEVGTLVAFHDVASKPGMKYVEIIPKGKRKSKRIVGQDHMLVVLAGSDHPEPSDRYRRDRQAISFERGNTYDMNKWADNLLPKLDPAVVLLDQRPDRATSEENDNKR